MPCVVDFTRSNVLRILRCGCLLTYQVLLSLKLTMVQFGEIKQNASFTKEASRYLPNGKQNKVAIGKLKLQSNSLTSIFDSRLKEIDDENDRLIVNHSDETAGGLRTPIQSDSQACLPYIFVVCQGRSRWKLKSLFNDLSWYMTVFEEYHIGAFSAEYLEHTHKNVVKIDQTVAETDGKIWWWNSTFSGFYGRILCIKTVQRRIESGYPCYWLSCYQCWIVFPVLWSFVRGNKGFTTLATDAWCVGYLLTTFQAHLCLYPSIAKVSC